MVTLKTFFCSLVITVLIFTAQAYATTLPQLDGTDKTDYIAERSAAFAPESGILLLVGSGLMGIALYRRLKNR